MKVKGRKVFLTKLEIKREISRSKRFKKYLDKHEEDFKNPALAMILIYKYMESEGWDFSKTGKKAMPKYLRNVPKHPYFLIEENGNIIYL